MAGVRIVSDSSCDLTQEEADGLGIEIVPLTIRFGDQEYTDRVDLSVTEFYAKLATSAALPETAAPSPGAFEQAFRKLAGEGADAVVCINISSDLSATIQSAQQAARSLDGEIDVRVIDSLSITAGLGTMVLIAAQAARDGKSADEIVGSVEALVPRTHVFGALDTLENLKKGGRIGGAQAMLGTMLSIKPIIDISTGKVEEAAKQRTRKKELLWMRDNLFAAGQVEHLAIYHGEAPDVDEFLDLIAERYPRDQLRIGLIGAVIGTHGGPRVLGTCWVDP